MTGTQTRAFSRYPVYIKAVGIYSDDTYSSIGIDIDANNYGNVFFGDDDPEFDVSMSNRVSSEVLFSVDYNIYKYDNNMRKTLIRTDTKTYNLAAGQPLTEKIKCPVDRFGLYCIEVKAYSDTVSSLAEESFAKCVLNNSLNKHLGANGETSGNLSIDPDAYFTLMAKAGLGLHRTSFVWSNYEKVKGVMALNDVMRRSLDVCGENGIDQMVILFGNNSLYDPGALDASFVREECMPNYLAFIENVIQEPLFINNVSMIEVWNEPDLVQYLGPSTQLNTFRLRAEEYARILKQQYDTIMRVSSENDLNYKIGAGAISGGIYDDSRKNFTDRFLNELDGGKYFDAFTLHPYLQKEDPEFGFGGVKAGAYTYGTINSSSLAYRLQYYDSLLNGQPLYSPSDGTSSYVNGLATGNRYDFDIGNETWLTETGWSTAVFPSDDCIGDEYEHAVSIIRLCNSIRLNDFEDKTWLYCFADVGLRNNEKEHKFGLVNAYKSAVSYAPKNAYLAVSNYNKLTGNAFSATEVCNDDFKYVAKYSAPDKTVYIFWTSKPDQQTLAYDLEEDALYYDLFGNRLLKEEVMSDGLYILTGTPFYAVEKESVNKISSVDMILYDSLTDIEDTPIGLVNIKNAYAVINFNEISGVVPYTFVYAIYKDNQLVGVKKFDGEQSDNQIARAVYNVSHPENVEFDTMKMFLFSDLESLTSICQAKVYD